MRGPNKLARACASMLAFLQLNITFAQPETPPAKDSAAKIAESARVSAADKKKNTEQMLAELREALRRTSDLEGKVRAEGDMVKLTCVQDKIVQEKGLVDRAESASIRMYQAMSKGIAKQVNNEYLMIVVAHQKAQILLSDAELCKGKVDVEEPVITEEQLSSFEEEDPTEAPADPLGPIVPPVASPF